MQVGVRHGKDLSSLARFCRQSRRPEQRASRQAPTCCIDVHPPMSFGASSSESGSSVRPKSSSRIARKRAFTPRSSSRPMFWGRMSCEAAAAHAEVDLRCQGRRREPRAVCERRGGEVGDGWWLTRVGGGGEGRGASACHGRDVGTSATATCRAHSSGEEQRRMGLEAHIE